jgi:hypothetical protein
MGTAINARSVCFVPTVLGAATRILTYTSCMEGKYSIELFREGGAPASKRY